MIRILVFCVVLITCKIDPSQLQFTDEELAELKKQVGARTGMVIDSDFNLHMHFPPFMPIESGEIIGATVELESYTNIELGEPDADGIASPLADDGDPPVGKWLRVNLQNQYGHLCKVKMNSTVHDGIIYQLNQWQNAEDDEAAALIYTTTDDKERLCVDDRVLPLRVLNLAMGSFGVGSMLPDKAFQERVTAYKESQQKFLADNTERNDVQEFMLRTKMLDGHFALRDQLQDGQEGTLINSVLGAFISDSHNVMPSEEILKDEDSLALQVTKMAVAGAVSRFLLYQQVFNAAEFSVDKFNDDFNAIEWHADLAPAVASVKTNYPSNTEGMKTFSSVNSLITALTARIGYMNNFMRTSIAMTGECESHLEKLYQGIHNPELYAGTLAKSDKGFNSKLFESQVGDTEGILLMTGAALTQTKLNNVCDAFAKSIYLIPLNDSKGNIGKIVASVKESVLKTLKDFNEKYIKELNKSHYLPDLIASHMFALPPVITFSNQDISAVVAPLVKANEQMTKKEGRDKFWSRFAAIISAVVGVLGIVALISFLFPPAFPVVTGLASLAALLSLVGSAILLPTYTVDWLNERSAFRSLERNILAGGSQDYGEQIKNLSEFRAARFEALTTGVGVALFAAPAARLIKDPRAFSAANRPVESVKGLWGKANRPFKWAWGTIRHPIQSAKNIPSASKAMWGKISKGMGDAATRARGLQVKKITGINAANAKRSISQFLRNSAKQITDTTNTIVRNNLNAWKADAGWLKLRKLKKANKDVLKKVKFKMKFNPEAVNGGGTIDVINRAPYSKADYDEIMGLVREVYPQKNSAWQVFYVNG